MKIEQQVQSSISYIDDTIIHTPRQTFIISHAGYSGYNSRPIPCRHQGFKDIRDNRRHSKQLPFLYEGPDSHPDFVSTIQTGRILTGTDNWDHIIYEYEYDYDEIVFNNTNYF